MTEETSQSPALLFDLDGTLIDSVYQHVLAWHEALEELGLSLAVWRIHRRIGMSGGLLVQALGREIGHRVTSEQALKLQERHAAVYERYQATVQPLPGARELLQQLSRAKVPYAIATSGLPGGARPALERLGIGPEVPVITRQEVQRAKPDPTCFLLLHNGSMSPSAKRWLPATVCGIYWPPGELAVWGSGCFREAMGKRN
jgi:beta-phosphoglucomutase-like phosphatase (HAD superfamily)